GQNLGVVYLESARPALALKAFVDTRDAWLGIVERRSELGYDLANTWGWIAKAHETVGAFDLAIEAQKTKAEVLRKLPDIAKNRRAQRLLANADYELGRQQLALGHYPLAALAARSALAQIETLAGVDPANTDL